VAVREIELGRFQTTGDELELTVRGDQRELAVDGKRSFGSVPELERIGKEALWISSRVPCESTKTSGRSRSTRCKQRQRS